MNFFLNWKTTVSGGLTAAMGAAGLFGIKVGQNAMDPATALGMITGGIGIMFAKDMNVTGGNVSKDGPVNPPR